MKELIEKIRQKWRIELNRCGSNVPYQFIEKFIVDLQTLEDKVDEFDEMLTEAMEEDEK